MAEEKRIAKKTTPYFDSYKARYEAHLAKKIEERQKQQSGGIVQKAEEEIKIVEQKGLTREQKIIEEVREKLGDSINYLKEPKHIKILKVLVILVVLGIIGYLITVNFLISRDFNYFYDIGSEGENYLSPASRISDSVEGDSNYRDLISNLVYFNVPIARGSENVNLQTKFKDNFPNKSVMSLGAKDQEVWHYNYNSIYNPTLNHLSEFPKKENVYLINPDLYILMPEELKYERNIVVATDTKYSPLTNIISNYENKETIINTSLRGGHTFYIYASGDLNLEIKKQDINWYDNPDELEISLYDLEENLIANTIIEDDGITNVTSKLTAEIQKGALQANDLKEGIYRLEFLDFDGLITEIKINTNKIVSNKMFLADNELYNVETKKSELYTELSRDSEIRFMTYHSAGIQNISYIKEGESKVFNFYQEDEPLYLSLSEGKYSFEIPENDVIISGVGYFAFSEENYFEPFKQKVVNIQNDIEWIKNNVDYIVTDYKLPIFDNKWVIAETEFNIERDSLFVKDNKLSAVFNIPHLSQETTQNYTIPLDWIKITVHKPGLFEKWGWFGYEGEE